MASIRIILWKIKFLNSPRCGKKLILGPNLLSTAVNDGSLEATVFMVNEFQSLSLKLQKHFFYVYPKENTKHNAITKPHLLKDFHIQNHFIFNGVRVLFGTS